MSHALRPLNVTYAVRVLRSLHASAEVGDSIGRQQRQHSWQIGERHVGTQHGADDARQAAASAQLQHPLARHASGTESLAIVRQVVGLRDGGSKIKIARVLKARIQQKTLVRKTAV